MTNIQQHIAQLVMAMVRAKSEESTTEDGMLLAVADA